MLLKRIKEIGPSPLDNVKKNGTPVPSKCLKKFK